MLTSKRIESTIANISALERRRFRRDQIDKWMDEHTVKVRMGRGAAD